MIPNITHDWTPSNYTLQQYIRDVYQIVIPVMIAACVLGLLANAFVLYSYRWIAQKHMSTTLILAFSLALADLWTAFLLAIGLVINSYLRVVWNVQYQSKCLSLILESLRLGSVITSILHLTVLAGSHYLAAAKSITFRQSFKSKHAFTAILIIWTIPPISLLVAFGILSSGFQATKCGLERVLEGKKFRITLAVFLLLPLVAISIFYMRIIFFIRKREKLRQLTKISTSGPSSSMNSASRNRTGSHSFIGAPPKSEEVDSVDGSCLLPSPSHSGHAPKKISFASVHLMLKRPHTDRHMLRRSFKTTVTSLLMVASSFISLCPVLTLYVAILFVTMPVKTILAVSIFSNLLLILKSLVNPFLYAGRIPEVKRAVKVMMHQRCRKHSQCSSSRNPSNFNRKRVDSLPSRAFDLDIHSIRKPSPIPFDTILVSQRECSQVSHTHLMPYVINEADESVSTNV